MADCLCSTRPPPALTSSFRLQENPVEAFSLWQKTHSRSYKTVNEAKRRQAVFLKNAQHVAATNARTDTTLRLALNQFADLTYEEFATAHLGYKPTLRKTCVPAICEEACSCLQRPSLVVTPAARAPCAARSARPPSSMPRPRTCRPRWTGGRREP